MASYDFYTNTILNIQNLRVDLGRYFIPISTKLYKRIGAASKLIPLPTQLSCLMQQRLGSGHAVRSIHNDVGFCYKLSLKNLG